MQHILVIDDDEVTSLYLCGILQKAGFEVSRAKDGQEGMNIIEQKPAMLIIVDIFMPVKDGIETITEVREKGLPCKILAISGGSAYPGEDYLEFSMTLGADAILYKPFESADLLRTVRELLPEA